MIRDTTHRRKALGHCRLGAGVFFIINLLAMIATVVVVSFATRWLGTWLPAGWTTNWYFAAWRNSSSSDVLIVTFQIVFAVVLLSGLLA